jgi:hypothetical protein
VGSVKARGMMGRAGERREKKGQRELLKRRRGTREHLYLAERRAGRLRDSDAMKNRTAVSVSWDR